MIHLTRKQIDKIISRHQHWVKRDCRGWDSMRADFSGATLVLGDFSSERLSSADFSHADLTGARMVNTDLSGARLKYATFIGADMSGANLANALLDGATLINTNLSGTDLSGANLSNTNLTGANLRGAIMNNVILEGANLNNTRINNRNLRFGKVLDSPLTGYKTTLENVVITVEIPAGAIVFCINGNKYRANRAKITDMAGYEILHSHYDPRFEYRLGQEIEIKDFNLMYNIECASGFHFFRTRKEAKNYF